MGTPDKTFRGFTGIDNVNAPFRQYDSSTGRRSISMTAATDVDIDNTLAIRRRTGRTRIYSGTPNSCFAEGSICLFEEGGSLKLLNQDYTATTLATIGSTKVSYVSANNQIFLTNNDLIGYVFGHAFNRFPSVTIANMPYKIAPIAGHIIEFFHGRLFVARDNAVFFSDPFDLGVFDIKNNIIPFDGHVTLMKAVDDGIYFSYIEQTGAGKTGYWTIENGVNWIDDSMAFEGAVAKIDVKYIDSKLSGTAIMWASDKGIYVGQNGGIVLNKTLDHYKLPTGLLSGTALYKNNQGMPQFIAALR